jgi:hypothetical protein
LSSRIVKAVRRWVEPKEIKVTREVLSQNSFVNPDIGHLEICAESDVFVFSMPKCATSAVQRGFDAAGRPALHAHNNPTLYDAFSNGAVLKKAGVGLEQLMRLRLRDNSRSLYVFFGYREPVSWYLSLAGHFHVELNQDLKDRIRTNLTSGYPWARYGIAETLGLIEAGTGIDIWRKPFDRSAGYSRYSKGNAHLIVYRFDRLAELERMIVSDIEPGFVMRHERANANATYLEYVRDFRLTGDVLEDLFGGEFFDYFYSPSERKDLINRYLA